MAFRFQRTESVADGLRRIVDQQITRAVAEIDDGRLNSSTAVHQVRKRCKKIRAVLRLVRPSFAGDFTFENRFFRDLARELSSQRDAAVLMETCAALRKKAGNDAPKSAFDGFCRRLESQQPTGSTNAADASKKLARARAQLEEARVRVVAWELEADGFEALRDGLLKCHSRARKALRAAARDGGDEAFHEWRKRAKDQLYQTKLLRRLWPAVFSATLKEAAILSDLLGDDHDLAVLRSAAEANRDAFSRRDDLHALIGLIENRSRKLRRRAFRIGERLNVEKPKRLVRRYRGYWKIWRKKQVG